MPKEDRAKGNLWNLNLCSTRMSTSSIWLAGEKSKVLASKGEGHGLVAQRGSLVKLACLEHP